MVSGSHDKTVRLWDLDAAIAEYGMSAAEKPAPALIANHGAAAEADGSSTPQSPQSSNQLREEAIKVYNSSDPNGTGKLSKSDMKQAFREDALLMGFARFKSFLQGLNINSKCLFTLQ